LFEVGRFAFQVKETYKGSIIWNINVRIPDKNVAAPRIDWLLTGQAKFRPGIGSRIAADKICYVQYRQTPSNG